MMWVMSCGFCSKFHVLSSSAKSVKIGYDWIKLQRVFIKVKTFLRHSVLTSLFLPVFVNCVMQNLFAKS